MTSRSLISSSIACTTLLAVALIAQDTPPAQPGIFDIAGIPPLNGIYYRASVGWVALSSTVLMPFFEGRSVALEILNVGSDHASSQIPGTHSGIQIVDPHPTFYLRGIDPSNLYLVRAASKEDYRELRMPVSRHFWEWAHYAAKDITAIEVQAVNGNVVAIKPSADLKPGEYALATGVQTGDQWLRLGFDFGIRTGNAGQ
jgi:hypothetical protein